jgi:AcrR family transcriptional regulator
MKTARERILVSADRIYRKEGLGGLSLRAVARDVGVTPMAIYRHYQDKDALVDALVADGFAAWEAKLGVAVRARTPMKVIERSLLAYGEFALEEARHFELMFLTRRRAIPSAPASLASSPSPSATRLIEAVHRAMETGAIEKGDPAGTLLLLWSAMHGMVALHFTGRFGHSNAVFRRQYREMVGRLLRLLKRSP